jgi:hypothetical protein
MGRDEECRRAHDQTGRDAFDALRGEIERVRQQFELAESKISATVFTELRGMEARIVVVALVYIATKIALANMTRDKARELMIGLIQRAVLE